MVYVQSKGRTLKISGLPIIKAPKGKMVVIRDFHILNHKNINEVIKYGTITYKDQCDHICFDIQYCHFENK